MRQSSSALRKLIRPVAAAGFWSGEANGEERFPGTQPELEAPRNRYWDTLLMGPAAGSEFITVPLQTQPEAVKSGLIDPITRPT
jgi:hypothetical protein